MNKIIEEHHDESGKWHRVGGPAVTHPSGNMYWYRHGKLHRRGGPASNRASSRPSEGRLWCVNGAFLKAPKQLPSAIHPIMELFL